MKVKELKKLITGYFMSKDEIKKLLDEINNVKETWADIQNYEGLYQVSNYGNFRSVKNGKFKKPYSGVFETGYVYVYLYNKGKMKNITAHRLVALAFVENVDNKKTVNHKYGNKQNNAWWNLEWQTQKEQIQHAKEKLGVKYDWGKGKPLVPTSQYTLDGVFIKKYPSRLQASIETGVQKSSISDCVRGIYKTAGGFLWKNG